MKVDHQESFILVKIINSRRQKVCQKFTIKEFFRGEKSSQKVIKSFSNLVS